MLFLGTTFFSGAYTIDPPAANVSPITEISLTNGVYDHLYVGKSVDEEVDVTNNEWTENTLLSAPFDENLDAGNSGFSLRNTDTVIIKRREKGQIDWTTIYVKPIKTIDDFKLIYFDRYARSNTNYEYVLCSVCNGIENSYVLKEVYSQFDGFFVVDQNNSYGTFFNLDGGDTQRNAAGEATVLLNNRYAKVIKNNISNYDTGTASGVFLKMYHNGENSCNIDIDDSYEIRMDVMDFLMNGKPKILKWNDGRIWLIAVTGSPTDSQEQEGTNLRKISFQFAEIGNWNDPKTLYLNGLNDVPPEWW